MPDPRLGFDSYTSEGDFYRDDSPEQQRIDEQRDFAFGGGLLKGITELPLDIMEFLSPEDEYNPGALAPDQSSPRQRIRTERLHGEQFYDELKQDPITKQAAEVGYGASMVVDPVLDTGLMMAPHLLKGLNAIRKGEKPAIKLADLMTDEVGAIRAFHGTPHEVDKFSMDKIGTGEGAQAYGHGLYFAENENVARQYDLAGFSSDVKDIDWRNSAIEDVRRLTDEVTGLVDRKNSGVTGLNDEIDDIFNEIDRLEDGISNANTKIKPKGNLYEVDLDVDPEELLDWDAKISSDKRAIDILDDYNTQAEAYNKTLTGMGRHDKQLRPIQDSDPIAVLYERLGGLTNRVGSVGGREGATEYLKDKGIKGIRYFDQNSRSAGEGTRNAVMFDENLINIVGKDGKPVTPPKPASILKPNGQLDLEAIKSRLPSTTEDKTDRYLTQLGKAPRKPKRIYRGVNADDTGQGVASLGDGYYTTRDKSFARKFGDKVVDVDVDMAWPDNPLVLHNAAGGSANALRSWALSVTDIEGMRELNKLYPDIGTFVRELGFDGVVIGDEIVKY